MRTLVLGAAGFIGGQVARAAHEAGMEVHGLRRQPGAVGAVGDVPIRWHQGDIMDEAALADAMHGCEIVFHAAGYYPYTTYSVREALRLGASQMRTVLGTALRSGVQRVVYTSSFTTIGQPPPGESRPANEQDRYLPGSTGNPYYEAKWAMECEALHACDRGLPVVILCPTAVFGPGDVKPSTSQILLLLAQRRLPVAVDATNNFVDGRDVALAHVRAAERGEPGERYIIGGHTMNISTALREAAHVMGLPAPRVTLSSPATVRLLRLAALMRLPIPATLRGMPYWQPLDTSRGWATFELSPRPFEDTVRDTYAWFREHGYV